jgi:hypothetical protein
MIPAGPVKPTNVRGDSRSLLSLAGIAELLASGEVVEVGNYAAGDGIEIMPTVDWKRWKSVFSPVRVSRELWRLCIKVLKTVGSDDFEGKKGKRLLFKSNLAEARRFLNRSKDSSLVRASAHNEFRINRILESRM